MASFETQAAMVILKERGRANREQSEREATQYTQKQ
jgi:hypothetical protein